MARTNKPNIVFIMPDQLRHDFLSCYGASFIDTPNIDSLADHGVRYDQCYSEHPICVAARASLITGMNAIKTGTLHNGQFVRPDYQACGISTWPELLNQQGYCTVATGKMHFYPWEAHLGFQHRVIAEDKCWGYIQDDYYRFLAENGHKKTDYVDVKAYHRHFGALVSPHPLHCAVDYWTGQESVRWIEEYAGDEPFAMMVGFPGPHNPYDPPVAYATFEPENMPEPLPTVAADSAMMVKPSEPVKDPRRKSWYALKNEGKPGREDFLRMRAHYCGLVKLIDDQVGAIVEALREKGELDNTVILFTSDHGDYLGDHGLTGKGSFYEGSCHVPLIARVPDTGNGRVADDLVTLTDVTSTILSLAGCQVPAYMDSQPLPTLGLASAGAPREQIAGTLVSEWMLFDGRWKLCKYRGGSHLYDLSADPAEQRNRIADPDCTEVRQRLDTALTAQIMSSLDQTFFPNRVYYGYSYSPSLEFGQAGWERVYPKTWEQAYTETDW